MVKLLHKKEISTEESPIMLQRRHTIMDVDKDGNLAEPKLKSITRSSSTSSLNQTKNKKSEVNSSNKQADTTLSPDGSISASIASTVVITDSELSSSWLYNNKKAQITPEPAKTFNSARVTEMRDEMRSPMLPKSKMRSNSMVRGRAKTSSCCCYALIILIIGVAALGILAAIGSILYMEFFASYNVTDIQITTTKPVSQDSVPLKKVGHSLGKEHQISNLTKSPGRVSESVLFSDSSAKDSEKAISSEKQNFDKNISVDENKVSLNETDSSMVIIDDLLNLTSQMINSAITDQKGILNPINNLFSRNQNVDSHYSKLFELYQGLRPTGSSGEKSVKSDPLEPISQTVDISNIDDSVNNNSNSIRLLEDNENANIEEIKAIAKNSFSVVNEISSELSEDSSIVEGVAKGTFVVHKDDTENLSEAEGAVKDSSAVSENIKDLFGVPEEVARDVPVSEDMPKDLSKIDDDLSHFRLNNIVEEKNLQDVSNIPFSNPPEKLVPIQKEISELNREVNELEPDLEKMKTSHKPAIAIPEEKLDFPNSFRTVDIDFEEKISNEQSKVSDLDQPLANLPIVGTTNSSNFIPKFLSQLDRAWGFPNFFRNPDEDLPNAQKEQTSVPADDADLIDLNRPVLETNIAVPRPVEMIRRFGNVHNEKNDHSNDLSQQDRQFSLAKALDRLRLLDANNILPSSRQKSKMASQKKKEEPKIQTNQEVVSERSHYLENLRKRFFDNE